MENRTFIAIIFSFSVLLTIVGVGALSVQLPRFVVVDLQAIVAENMAKNMNRDDLDQEKINSLTGQFSQALKQELREYSESGTRPIVMLNKASVINDSDFEDVTGTIASRVEVAINED